jgi:hypothetical protein
LLSNDSLDLLYKIKKETRNVILFQKLVFFIGFF